ncbi:CRISPR-associated protein Cas4 [Pinisolibacter aquiterrae]|uniref:CRISPR-associated protein Cas4 n=1 Tax=Pinisolibacter aquiterrae TaxID=2815579 RepID=UPI001C3D10DC|nr:CRISPR-associated protein Cas4 [Pinisolibacter aquiterrae]MBV5263908.1 CRISPR-associated protein Cas4 [Pinisolibacter aquiterrae]MCC8235919.1 CRISPR-associated protein Cas4 [Pinisolibacter aquiterrae]
MDDDGDPLPLSALQHMVYCPRQAALIHVERLWEENRLTAEGRILHTNADEPGAKRRAGIRRVTALPLRSRRLGVAGVADLVEFHRAAKGEPETALPVEFKRGRPKLHRADEVQLCAQAMALEEALGRPVPEGALFYAETRRRLVVPIDDGLRRETIATAEALAAMVASGRTPAAVWRADRCRACSLLELCRPKAGARSAAAWLRDRIAETLDPAPGVGEERP